MFWKSIDGIDRQRRMEKQQLARGSSRSEPRQLTGARNRQWKRGPPPHTFLVQSGSGLCNRSHWRKEQQRALPIHPDAATAIDREHDGNGGSGR
ncbi:hypothetical protein [Paenibacillus periandrae]|uniref:hypothetical protein n=1 Tax=Paenibacillus periandrae TaxID=1761741 RepID=UPI001F08CDD9|nr:hypothetical protein [Paenibacillus periandrae]